jgi:hypothetical protein
MAKSKDLTGKKFGLLTVTEKAGKDKHGHILWKCECDCGGTKIVKSGDLGRGIKSCGCLKHRSGPGNSNWKGGKIEVKCANPGCDKTKMIHPSHEYDKSYCSDKCRSEHYSQLRTGSNNPRYKDKIKVACAYCGNEKEIIPAHYERNATKQFFCHGTGCYGKWCSENRNGKANPNYHGGTPEKRKIRKRIAAAMRKAIREKKAGRHWEELVDYNLEDLTKHLKSTLPEGYSWEDDFVNGDNILHIDHVIPMSAFNFDLPTHMDFKKCFALNNLQLLPAIENMQKSARLNEPFQQSLAF